MGIVLHSTRSKTVQQAVFLDPNWVGRVQKETPDTGCQKSQRDGGWGPLIQVTPLLWVRVQRKEHDITNLIRRIRTTLFYK